MTGRRDPSVGLSREASRGEADFADTVLSAMRMEFGGHVEKGAP
jgi:6-phosphogluconate dehydrogenase (decarboxylating)